MIRQEPFLINLYLPSHQHSAYVNNRIRANRKSKQHSKMPIKNSLFDCSNKVEPSIRRISIVHEAAVDGAASASITPVPLAEFSTISQTSEQDLTQSARSSCTSKSSLTNEEVAKNDLKQINCDCDNEDRLMLLDTILTYFESPVSVFFFFLKQPVTNVNN